MEGELRNLSKLVSTVIALLCYCYFVSSKIPIGKFRLISLLPVLYVFAVLPLSLSSAFNTFLATFFVTWLANFKLLLFAFGQGPLYSDPPISLPFFISVACLPIRQGDGESGGAAKPRAFPFKISVLLFAVLVGILNRYGDRFPKIVVMYAYIWVVFVLMEILVFTSSAVIRAFSGVELELPSDEPYLATSLQELWGKRWNLTATNSLRNTVYKPVRWAASPVVGRRWAALAGILASFVVSGLLHELVFYYVTRVPPTWEMTAYFLLQGSAVVVEAILKRAIGGKWTPPPMLSRVLTLGFGWGTSFLLFFPPLMRSRADEKMIDDVAFFVQLVASKVKSALAIST